MIGNPTALTLAQARNLPAYLPVTVAVFADGSFGEPVGLVAYRGYRGLTRPAYRIRFRRTGRRDRRVIA